MKNVEIEHDTSNVFTERLKVLGEIPLEAMSKECLLFSRSVSLHDSIPL